MNGGRDECPWMQPHLFYMFINPMCGANNGNTQNAGTKTLDPSCNKEGAAINHSQ